MQNPSLDEEPKGPSVFGKDVSKIPCFRDSWLFGFSSALGLAFLGFMGTSKPRVAFRVGTSGLVSTTVGYWIYCRYKYYQEMRETAIMQKYMREFIATEGTAQLPPPSMPSSPEEIEIATVSNTMKNP